MARFHLFNWATVRYRVRLSVFFFLTYPVVFHGTGIFLAHPSGTREGLFPFNLDNCYARLLTVPIRTRSLPVHEERPKPGSLFASRTLPPLHPHPRPQPYPLLRPSEWPPSSHRRDDEGGFRRLGLQGGDQSQYPVSPSPLATPSSDNSHNQR